MSTLSIVIITFNSKAYIRSCLDSIFAHDAHGAEVIVVDNGSRDGTAGLIEKEYPQVLLIPQEQNTGACQARNRGIGVSRGEWILALDCDVVLEDDFITRLCHAVQELPPGVGMLQPLILFSDKKRIYSAGIYLTFLRRFYDLHKNEPRERGPEGNRDIFGTCSAASCYRRKMLEEIKEDTGYFDERFFFLVEDVDVSWRAQEKGWTAALYPSLVCYHSGNSSSCDKQLRQFFCWRNSRYLLEKHRSSYPRALMIHIFYAVPRVFCLYLLNAYVRQYIRFPVDHLMTGKQPLSSSPLPERHEHKR